MTQPHRYMSLPKFVKVLPIFENKSLENSRPEAVSMLCDLAARRLTPDAVDGARSPCLSPRKFRKLTKDNNHYEQPNGTYNPTASRLVQDLICNRYNVTWNPCCHGSDMIRECLIVYHVWNQSALFLSHGIGIGRR